MIPPFLLTAAAKLAGLVLLAALLFGYGYYKGVSSVQARWDAAVSKQAMETSKTVIKQAQATAKVVTKYIYLKGEREIITETVEKEVVKYVDAPHPACVVPVEFERLWDSAAGHGLPPDASPAGRTDADTDSGLTLATVLSAGTDYAHAYYVLRDKHAALVEWIKTTYPQEP